MAQNEIVNVLTIKTEDSQKTIKGLKKEISDLKKVLDNAVIGTEEFEQANRDLKVAQNELKAAMTGQKQSVEALDGSYDALVQEMAKLKKEWRATADVVKRDDLGKQIDNINNQLKELDGTIGNNQRKVGAYAEEFGKALEKNNETITASAENFKKALAEQDDATISTRTKLESVQKVTAGLASGYAAVQGTMALLGIENENLEKTFVKLQAAMAIAQGVGGMKDLVEGLSRGKVAFAGAANGVKLFIKGLSGVQKAIIGTGIGALVVAIGLLIANWDKITKLFKKSIPPVEDTADAMERLNNAIKTNEINTKNLNSETLVKYAKQLVAASGDIEKTRKILKAFNEEQKKNIRQNYESNISTALNEVAKTEKALIPVQERFNQLQKEVDAWTKGGNGPDLVLKKRYKNAKEEFDKINDTLKIQKQKLKEYQDAYNNYLNQPIIDAAKEKVAEADRKKEEQKQKILTAAEQRAEKQKEIDEELRLSKLNEEEKLIDALDKKYIEYMKVYEGNQEKQLEILTWYTDEYTKIVEIGLDEQIAAQQAAAEESERIEKEKYANLVAASEQRLDKKLTNIDAGAETATYLNERKKPAGNGEINAIDNELSKLETLKSITNETLNLKVAAIEAEQALFEKSTERWMELENQKVALREQTNRTLGELSEQYNEQEKNRNRVLAGSITNTFTAALSSASAIIGALQEGIDTTTKEGFERNKKMQIAQATIQMLVGITSALAGAYTTKSGPWDWVLAGIQAATIATTGGIQIANIRKQTFDGGGSSTSVTPTLGMSDNLPVSYTRNLMGDMETDTMNAAQRVYILESDIDESLRKVEVRDNNTNF